MQEIREKFEQDGLIKEVMDRMTGKESEELKDAFSIRSLDVLKRHTERVEKGIKSSLTINEKRNISKNDPCPCGSNIEFQKCCGVTFSESD